MLLYFNNEVNNNLPYICFEDSPFKSVTKLQEEVGERREVRNQNKFCDKPKLGTSLKEHSCS